MLSNKDLKILLKEYNDNFGYLWFKNFNESEQFFNYLCDNKLDTLAKSISHGASRSEVDGWGYAVIRCEI